MLLSLAASVLFQGLLVYGRHGREIFRRNLEPDICREVNVRFYISSNLYLDLVSTIASVTADYNQEWKNSFNKQ